MVPERVKRVLIVGGGTAGWMAASFLSQALGKTIRIEVVESDEISTVGVGEATIPPINKFNEALGIDENEFVKATQASFKLGIQFRNWGAQGDSYIHGFGSIGHMTGAVEFHHYWLKMFQEGKVDLAPFITARIRLDRLIEDGFEALINHKETAVKIIVSPRG